MLLVASSVLMAKPYTMQDRIHDMNEMASAMNIIQSGFFYNNYSTVEAGVAKLKPDTIVQFERYGFVRVDKTTKSKIFVNLAHK